MCIPFIVPTGTGKPGKWEGIFQSGKKSGDFVKIRKVSEKLGNFTQNTQKIRKNMQEN